VSTVVVPFKDGTLLLEEDGDTVLVMTRDSRASAMISVLRESEGLSASFSPSTASSMGFWFPGAEKERAGETLLIDGGVDDDVAGRRVASPLPTIISAHFLKDKLLELLGREAVSTGLAGISTGVIGVSGAFISSVGGMELNVSSVIASAIIS
jgi:hypothetical protein